jgi:hypothetical protein
MTRLSYVFYSGCALGVLLFALSCASGNNSVGDGSLVDSGMKGDTGAGGNKSNNDTPLVTCGNGKIDSPEVCDGQLLGNATCASLSNNQKTGTLKCASTCRNYDESMCYDQNGTGGTNGGSGTSGSPDATVAPDGSYSR